MSMSESSSYREGHIDSKIKDHESRITKNERRWLVAKGLIVGIALTEGSSQAINIAMGFI